MKSKERDAKKKPTQFIRILGKRDYNFITRNKECLLTETILLVRKVFAVVQTITNECLVYAMTVLNTNKFAIQASPFTGFVRFFSVFGDILIVFSASVLVVII